MALEGFKGYLRMVFGGFSGLYKKGTWRFWKAI
jgi:hypothetical protein